MKAWVQGALVDEDKVSIPLHNRAFRYADGCFETMALIGNTPAFWTYHIDRLYRTLEALHIQPETDAEGLVEIVCEVLEANSHHSLKRMKITAYRDGAGKYTPETNQGCWLIEADDTGRTPHALPVLSVSAVIPNSVRLPAQWLGNFKTVNKTTHVLAGIEAKDHNAQEAILLNDRGEVVECIASNLFVVKGDQIMTPPLSSGCLDGVMRRILLDAAQDRVVEKVILANDLEEADELWSTNALNGIRAITKLASREYGTHKATEWQQRIRERAASSVRGFQENRP